MDPFIGEIVMFAGNFAPRGWALCDGQLLSISANQALFSILGTTYGGDGRTTFALPDLRGRAPIHPGTGPGLSTYRLGQRGGTETVTLNQLQIPSHTHIPINNQSQDQHIQLSSTDAVNETPAPGDVPAVANFGSGLNVTKVKSFGPLAAGSVVNGQTISGSAGLTLSNTGGNQYHTNVQPFECVNFIIAMVGVFPSRN